MGATYEVGELVHIPQAVTLIDCDVNSDADSQMIIPLRTEETDSPKVGIVATPHRTGGYVRVYCDGTVWSVKDDRVYSLSKVKLND